MGYTEEQDLKRRIAELEAERDELQAMNQRQIETMEGMSKRHVEAYQRLAAANMYIRKLTAKLAVANWLLDEIKDLCNVQENFPFRGHLLEILAKRKGVE